MPAYKYTNRDAGQPSLPKKATSTEVITEWLSEKKLFLLGHKDFGWS